MFITEGSISLAASYQYVERHTESASLTVWVGDRPVDQPATRPPASPADRLELSPESKVKAARTEDQPPLDELEDELDPRMRLAKLIIEYLTGRRIRILKAKDFQPVEARNCAEHCRREPERAAVEERQGWGVSYTEEQTYAERQELSFTAEGVVRTRDGQEIKFRLELTASREFMSRTRFELRAGDALKVDPLVINFDGLATELADTAFQFDLNFDGRPEDIHFVKPGSGFLALDRNGDGEINDGRELFGPTTGDGLGELAAYDADGNRWIDEADPIYHQLQIWTKGPNGADALTPLKQAGIGASLQQIDLFT
ncbi:MAG: VCBS repeat-containing protein [Bacillota bacterium]|nr:VCBS repeat-containing protein [Bacillota bacterium]